MKSAKNIKSLDYSEGDVVHYTVYSGDNTTVISDKPDITKTIEVEFYKCKDLDNNSYKIVQIGEQWWMAENLKTTKLGDGTSILNLVDNSQWKEIDSAAFCWYETYMTIF